MNSQQRIIQQVVDERTRQDDMWGVQSHDPAVYLMILGEEVGEANKAALEAAMSTLQDRPEGLRKYREELVQVAAVAIAMIECLDRNPMTGGRDRFGTEGE